MTWIKTISFKDAKGKLKRLYERVVGPDGNVDNILMAHSLRPHSLEGHMALYKNVLHHNGNALEKYWLEALGVFVSHLNQCDYCVEHHYQGYKRLIGDEAKAERFYQLLKQDNLEELFQPKEICLFRYARKLTLSPGSLVEYDVKQLNDAGYCDGEILEVNQVVAYFNYANRTVLGLGVNTKGDILGLSPGDSDDPDNWSHH